MRRARVLAILLFLPVAAHAYDAEVAATTSAQAYELRGPGGGPTLVRRRITQTLRLGAYSLIPRAERGPRLDAQLLLRLDTDFGMDPGETDPDNAREFVPGLEEREIDLAFGYIDGRGFLGGWVDFRAGRQMVFDALGLYAFDGALVRVVTPYWVLVEAYGGFETQSASPLGPSRWGRDGNQQADTSAWADPAVYPSVRPEHLAPVYGVALASNGYFPLHSRWSYRETKADGGLGERRAGWAGDFTPTDAHTIRGQVVYDLGLDLLSEAQAGYEWNFVRPVTASIDVVHYVPTFTMDSIWNYFSVQPMDDARLGVRVRPSDSVELSTTGWVRLFGDQGAGTGQGSFPGPPTGITDTGGDVQARLRSAANEATLRLSAAGGFGGDRAGAEAYLSRSFVNDRYRAEVFPSVWWFEDDLRAVAADPARSSAVSFAYVLGGLYRYTREANLHLQYEHAVNRIVGNRFRLLAILDLRFWL